MSELKDRPVGVVGAGRVGTALAVAMVRAGYRLIGISARSPESRKRASLRLPQIPQQDALALAGRSQILFLTVSDDAVEPVATHLAENGGIAPGQYVVHTSGVLGLDALGAARRCGAVPLAIHPAMTFPGAESDADRLSGLAFAITTPAAARPIAERLVDDLGGVPVWIPEGSRTLYHAGLVLGANTLVPLVTTAVRTLAAAGVGDPAFVLAPLLHAALDHALALGDQALTGPVRRGDAGTVLAHIQALESQAPELVDGYRTLTRFTTASAAAAGTSDPEALRRIGEILDRPDLEEISGG